jgi:GNAT superfamily N-acetyltransferase
MTDRPAANPQSLDAGWLSRIEDAGLNASAPRQQRWVDGWLVRLSPGKAKRARCIQPVAPGRLAIEEKLALCLPLYAVAGLRAYVRITPFAEPARLDQRLAALGMERVDDSWVMALASLDAVDREVGPATETDTGVVRCERADAAAFAEWVGAARGSSAEERAAHANRIAQAPVPHHAIVLRDGSGTAIAGGQVAIEGLLAGLYDVFTIDEARGRGHAERVCRQLLGDARRRGATAAYLQVDAANDRARSIYRRLGFRDVYRYHYRTPPTAA